MSTPASRARLPLSLSPSTRTMMRVASTLSTIPVRLQLTTAPESLAVMYSIPVPM